MKNILVIGGAGFIGSNLCEHLVSQGMSVTSLDCYFTGSEQNHVAGVEYVKGYAKDLAQLFPHGEFDTVFHFGEYSRVEQSFEDIQQVFELNQQFISVLEWCREHSVKLIYSGSSTKFAIGDQEGKAMSPYAWTKAQNTELLKSYNEWFGLDYAIVYFYNVYGPREIQDGKYATLIAKFSQKMKAGEPLTVVLPGTQERNFTYVGDVVRALQLVGESGYGDGYGIGHTAALTVKQVAEMFGGDIQYLPERPGNRLAAQLVTDKTRALGWTPEMDLETYIMNQKVKEEK